MLLMPLLSHIAIRLLFRLFARSWHIFFYIIAFFLLCLTVFRNQEPRTLHTLSVSGYISSLLYANLSDSRFTTSFARELKRSDLCSRKTSCADYQISRSAHCRDILPEPRVHLTSPSSAPAEITCISTAYDGVMNDRFGLADKLQVEIRKGVKQKAV
ncbi:predicted protein [Sclerotinia sclerotiorum 1980 UF-70]|uniref:Uncharacterized protein n=1 Tax=Sclerotinia sclerotiorum (strain ATCC 18683 / 1980 / Ss-1) TaxID=665079 RepID=A7E541_SCLS1|nr:predicted protein [Sclerotinia sclerotiorum 1980 UF-70]EDN91013.1 predicted protein [Sclerotinia sclerotiorum 1980 UF-70]